MPLNALTTLTLFYLAVFESHQGIISTRLSVAYGDLLTRVSGFAKVLSGTNGTHVRAAFRYEKVTVKV